MRAANNSKCRDSSRTCCAKATRKSAGSSIPGIITYLKRAQVDAEDELLQITTQSAWQAF